MKQMKLFLVAALLAGVTNGTAQTSTGVSARGPVKVELKKNADGYQLTRNGEPFYVKGAGGIAYLDRLASYGGNSIRTWSTRNAQAVLDSAHKYGLTVLMGLDVARERHGFNYDDQAAVQQQLQKLKAEILQYKDHPALLAWGIGNELNLHYKNEKVWDAVNDISKMIHELDPHHPTTTALAGISKPVIDQIKKRAPDLDLLSVNTYGGLAGLPAAVRNAGWEGAYLVTEWGPTGHWECLETTWKAPIEETSSEKAGVYKSRYEYSMERDKANCVGSYVFLWGQKQERTPTWYGIFTENGEESEVVDVMQYLWTGNWPANRAPHIFSLQLDNRKANASVTVQAGASYTAKAFAIDPDNDQLSYRWELLPEATEVGEGGDYEPRPKAVQGLIKAGTAGMATLKAPAKEGAYRLFVYITDGNNNVATANIPFYVKQ